MAAAITSVIGPNGPRGRSGDTVVITGTGFSPTDNAVTFDGTTATISVQSATSITVTVPSGLDLDFQAEVKVTNNDDATFDIHHFFIMLAQATYVTQVVGDQQPSEFEDVDTEDDEVAEAKDHERWVSRPQSWFDEILPDAGGATVPNVTSGASRIGTDRDNFSNLGTPTADQTQAILEAIDGVVPAAILTTNGDTLHRDGAGNIVRLPIGAEGEVKTVVGGIPAWAKKTVLFIDVVTTRADDSTTNHPGQDDTIPQSGEMSAVVASIARTPATSTAKHLVIGFAQLGSSGPDFVMIGIFESGDNNAKRLASARVIDLNNMTSLMTVYDRAPAGSAITYQLRFAGLFGSPAFLNRAGVGARFGNTNNSGLILIEYEP